MIAFFQIIWPLFGFVACVAAMFLLKEREEKVVLSIAPFGIDWVHLQLPLTRLWLVRVICLLGALWFFLLPAFRDYSAFFPSNYKMSVFFDEIHLEELVGSLRERYQNSISVSADWKKRRAQYFESLDADAFRLFGLKGFFQRPERSLHSAGVMNFRTEKVKGFQRYKIMEAVGYLSHTREEPNKQKKVLITKFELVEDRNAYIEPSLIDVYLGRKIIVRPRFNQIITSRESGGSRIHHVVTAITETGIFPFPWVSDTVYLLEDVGGYVPIGYAVYEWR